MDLLAERIYRYESLSFQIIQTRTNSIQEESLLVLRGLGIQTTSSSSSYLSTSSTRFIPTTSIQDIFIHEAFKGFEVRFYLAIVVEQEQDVVVVFPVSTLPVKFGTRSDHDTADTSSITHHPRGSLARCAFLLIRTKVLKAPFNQSQRPSVVLCRARLSLLPSEH